MENRRPQDASEGAERLLIADEDLHRTKEGALKRPTLRPACWICMSLAERKDVRQQIRAHFEDSPTGFSYLLQFGWFSY